jgi:hypothetical protein
MTESFTVALKREIIVWHVINFCQGDFVTSFKAISGQLPFHINLSD